MKAVIFIDVQNDFIDGALPVDKDKKVTEKIRKYAYICKCEHVPMLATRDTHYDITLNKIGTSYEDTLEGKLLPVKHCIEDTFGWQLDGEFAVYVPADNIINKQTFGSIEDLPYRIGHIDDWLKSLYGEGVTEIELCGFCTDICLVSNALILRAAFPNLKITTLKNLCAGTTQENHEATLKVLASCQIDVRDAIV